MHAERDAHLTNAVTVSCTIVLNVICGLGHHRHHHRIANNDLDHLLTRSGLTRL
jgi:hypothetical protein